MSTPPRGWAARLTTFQLRRPALVLGAAAALTAVGVVLATRLEIQTGFEHLLPENFVQRLENEATALATLTHPNIVQFMAFGEVDAGAFLAMEYVPGSRTLASEMRGPERTLARLPSSQVRHILDQVLFGLEAAHDAGIVHRDIKPDNIMLAAVAGNACLVKLVDFGPAKFVAQSDATGVIIGTPQYLAPEQVLKRNIGPWTDLYAVGVLAFELLTGLRPFSGPATEIALRKIDPTAPAFDHASDLPAPLRRFLDRALAQAPIDRFRSAADMRRALAELLDPEVSAPCTTPVRRHVTSSSARALATASVAALFALVTVFAVTSRATIRPPVVEPAVSTTSAPPALDSVPPPAVRPPRPPARIEDGQSSKRGLCAEDDLRRAVAPHAASLRACYEERLGATPSLVGSLALHCGAGESSFGATTIASPWPETGRRSSNGSAAA